MTLLGQVASFMENLHLSYDEIVYKIPYRNLIIMQTDKLHSITGEKVVQKSGREMMMERQKQG